MHPRQGAALGHRSLAHQDQKPADKRICERFHKTVLDEFYRVAFRKKIYRSIDELQADLDAWIKDYNAQRPKPIAQPRHRMRSSSS